MSANEAQSKLVEAVQRWVSSEAMEPHAHYDAELELCDEMILEAARELVAAQEGAVPMWRVTTHLGGPNVAFDTVFRSEVDALADFAAEFVREHQPQLFKGTIEWQRTEP